MNGKELNQRVHEIVEDMIAVDLVKPEPEPLSEYRILWTIQGTTKVQAKDHDDAERQFDELDAEHLIKDLVCIELYDIDPQPEAGEK